MALKEIEVQSAMTIFNLPVADSSVNPRIFPCKLGFGL